LKIMLPSLRVLLSCGKPPPPPPLPGHHRHQFVSRRFFVKQERKSLFERMTASFSLLKDNNKKPPYHHFVQLGDPVLRRKAAPVDFDRISAAELQRIGEAMKLVLTKYDCVGVAAPQVGVPLRIIAMQFTQKQLGMFEPRTVVQAGMQPLPFTLVVNPQMQVVDKTLIEWREGCQSMSGYSGLVPRFKEVWLTGCDLQGAALPRPLKAKDWTARMVQHEMDHLEGQMYCDKLTSPQTLAFNYWTDVNRRKGKFRQSFAGVKSIFNFVYPSIIFKQKLKDR